MTPGERRQRFDEIIKDIDTATGFEDFSSHVAKILKSIPSSLTSQDVLNAKLKEYETVTDFARHHSTTRSAVLTFLVGLSFGVTGAILTKSKDLDTVAKIIGSCLAVTILFMACIFDYFFYGNLKAALDRGKALEEEVNNKLELDGNLALGFYQIPIKTYKLPGIRGDGPTVCLRMVTFVYIVTVIMYFIINFF